MPTKSEATQAREHSRLKLLRNEFGKYSLTALTSEIVANFRDARLSSGKANNTVRLELALLGQSIVANSYLMYVQLAVLKIRGILML